MELQLQQATISHGQDFWVSDEPMTVGTQCYRLIGILARKSDERSYLRICNCTEVCWVEGSMVREPDTQRSKFSGHLISECCQCVVTLQTKPCCEPVLVVTPDCFDVNSYDTCDPPTHGPASTIGLCYARGQSVTVTFPDTITCDSETLYFDYTETFICSSTMEEGHSTAVSFMIPLREDCPGPCHVKIIAYYKPECCNCELSIQYDPCCYGTLTIPEDCDGVTSYDLCSPPEVCYAHDVRVPLEFPDHIVCDGDDYMFDRVEVTYCGQSPPVVSHSRNITIAMPTAKECATQCSVDVVVYYVVIPGPRLGCPRLGGCALSVIVTVKGPTPDCDWPCTEGSQRCDDCHAAMSEAMVEFAGSQPQIFARPWDEPDCRDWWGCDPWHSYNAACLYTGSIAGPTAQCSTLEDHYGLHIWNYYMAAAVRFHIHALWRRDDDYSLWVQGDLMVSLMGYVGINSPYGVYSCRCPPPCAINVDRNELALTPDCEEVNIGVYGTKNACLEAIADYFTRDWSGPDFEASTVVTVT